MVSNHPWLLSLSMVIDNTTSSMVHIIRCMSISLMELRPRKTLSYYRNPTESLLDIRTWWQKERLWSKDDTYICDMTSRYFSILWNFRTAKISAFHIFHVKKGSIIGLHDMKRERVLTTSWLFHWPLHSQWTFPK